MHSHLLDLMSQPTVVMCVCCRLPVLRENEQLFRIVELLQHVGDKLAPPAFASTELHQQQASMKTDLGRPTDTEVLEKLFTGFSMEGALEHRGNRVSWQQVNKEINKSKVKKIIRI